MGSALSAMGDVYSYGILILEMMTGKRPTDVMFVEGLNLHNFAKMSLSDRLMDALDPLLVQSIWAEIAASADRLNTQAQERHWSVTIECLKRIMEIGVACSLESAQERTHISSVHVELHSIRKQIQESLSLV